MQRCQIFYAEKTYRHQPVNGLRMTFLCKIFGLILILLGLWCFIFAFIMIFNALSDFDKCSKLVKDFITFPVNTYRLQGAGNRLSWEEVKHLSGVGKIIQSVLFGLLLTFGGWALTFHNRFVNNDK